MSSVQEKLILSLNKCQQNSTETIKEGEAEIQQLTEENFKDVIIGLSHIIANTGIHINIRQLATTIIGNGLKQCSSNVWLQIQHAERLVIKNNLLNSLGPEDKKLQKNIGLCISFIAKIEYPVGEWENLISIIERASNDGNVENVITSFVILKNLLSGLKNHKTCLNNIIEQVFNIIFKYFDYQKLQGNDELLQWVLETAHELLPALNGRMNDSQFRLWFFQFIVNVLTFTTGKSFEAGIEICTTATDIFYSQMSDVINPLIDIFIKIADDTNIEKANRALTFLVELGDLEIEKENIFKNHNYYLKPYAKKLFEVVLKILHQNANSNNEDIIDETNINLDICEYLLDTLSKIDPELIVDSVFNDISQNIATGNSAKISISYFCFTAIMETSAKNKIEYVIPGSLQTMTSYFANPDENLLINLSRCVERIAEYHGKFILYQQNVLDLFMNIISQQLANPNRNLNTLKHYIKALINLLKNVIPLEIMSLDSKICGKLGELYNNLFTIIYEPNSYNSENNVSKLGFDAICELIEHSTNNDLMYVQAVTNNILNFLNQTFDTNIYSIPEKKVDFQNYLCEVIISLGTYNYLKLNFETAMQFYNALDTILKERQVIVDEAILAATSIIKLVETNKDTIFNNLWNYVNYGLNLVEEEATCQSCLLVFNELISLNLPSIQSHLPETINMVYNIISKNNNIQNLKIVIIDFYNEYIKQYFENFIPHIINSLDFVMDCAQMFNGENINNYDFSFAEKMKYSILMYLENCTHNVSQIKQEQFFTNHIRLIINFLNSVVFIDNTSLTGNIVFSHMMFAYPNPNCSTNDALTCTSIIINLNNVFGDRLIEYMTPSLISTLISKITPLGRNSDNNANYLRHILSCFDLVVDLDSLG